MSFICTRSSKWPLKWSVLPWQFARQDNNGAGDNIAVGVEVVSWPSDHGEEFVISTICEIKIRGTQYRTSLIR